MSKASRLLESIVRDLAKKGTLPQELQGFEVDRKLVLDDMGIDSLGLTSMLTEIEDRAGLELPEDALESFRKVGDIVDYLEEAMA